MTPTEFKAWFKGIVDATGGQPPYGSLWELIVSAVSEMEAVPATRPKDERDIAGAAREPVGLPPKPQPGPYSDHGWGGYRSGAYGQMSALNPTPAPAEPSHQTAPLDRPKVQALDALRRRAQA